jgi:hypothetical protein
LASDSNWLTSASSLSMSLFTTSISVVTVVVLDSWIFSKILRSLTLFL